jgi:carboxylesterase type B
MRFTAVALPNPRSHDGLNLAINAPKRLGAPRLPLMITVHG